MTFEDGRARYVSFASFRLDCHTGELRKGGRKVKLQAQPAKLLVLLATRAGETVTRSEIQSREVTSVSMMPPGLLDPLADSEVIDLVGYLKTTAPVK